jgi:hypothetical protein
VFGIHLRRAEHKSPEGVIAREELNRPLSTVNAVVGSYRFAGVKLRRPSLATSWALVFVALAGVAAVLWQFTNIARLGTSLS